MKRKFVVTIVSVCAFSTLSSIAFAADGFGQYATGGAGGTIVTPTTAAEFKTYVTSTKAYIVQVIGTIDLTLVGGKVDIRPNKTIRGVGPGATILGQLDFHDDGGNVIIERLNFTNATGGEGDAIAVKKNITNVFITKCTFYDCADGCVDITRGSDYVTVSWCKFYFVNQTEHRNPNLIGNDDDETSDMGKLHVTFHHNWWSSGCDQRMPSVRYGRAHCYNNYYDSAGNRFYCIRTRLYAECLVENNYFNEVQNPWERYITSAGGDPGLLYASGNILDNVTWNDTYDSGIVLIDGNDTVFTPPYSYTLEDTNLVPGIVRYGAGADGKDGYPPHWYFTFYGDFDISGFVDMNDFAQFAEYWQVNDCNQIADADYDGDCEVNFYEFSLFAENWLYIPPDTTPPAAPTGLSATAGNATVSLDWDDNSETDLAGYNVYRSTTSDSGYSKLNDSLLSSSNYTDSNVVNETAYYYVVTAVDTGSNESRYSSEKSAMPSAGTSDLTIQENLPGFCGVDGAVENEHSGYTGTGYANTENGSGYGIDWTINILTEGTYTFTWRYAHGSTDTRSARLLINDSEVVSSIDFPPTGAWTTWTTTSTNGVYLIEGVKTIRLEALNSGGLANIDYINVTGPKLMTASCP